MAQRLYAVCFFILSIALAAALPGCSDSVEPSSTCPLSISPAAFTPCVSGGSFSTSITTPSACHWTASANTSWLTILSGESGTGPGAVVVAYASNFDAPREGTFAIQTASPALRQGVRVSQAGCRYGVTPDSFSFDGSGGTATIDVTQQTEPYECGGPKQNACQWSAVAEASWIAITTVMPQVGDQPFRFVVAPATSILPRSGAIVVRDRVVHVLQAGR